MEQTTENWKQGLSDRHIAQIIRRKMITKTKVSKKFKKIRTMKKPLIKEGSNVKIKGQKQILTLTGEHFLCNGIDYIQVKERSFYIPKSSLIFL